MSYIQYVPYIPNIPYIPNMPYQTDIHTIHTQHTIPHPHHTTGGEGDSTMADPWPWRGEGGWNAGPYIYIHIFFRLYIILYLSQHEALGSHPKILSSVRFFRDFQQGTRTTEDEPMGDTPRQIVSGSVSKVDDGGKAPDESLIQSMVSCHISDISVELCKTIWYIMISWMIDILWYNTV